MAVVGRDSRSSRKSSVVRRPRVRLTGDEEYFAGFERDAFDRWVQENSATVSPLTSANSLLLDDHWTTSDGLSLSADVLVAVCHLVSPGLSRVVRDAMQSESPEGEKFAVRVYNEAVRFWFPAKLRKYRRVAVVGKRVVGVVGPRYLAYSQAEFWQDCQRAFDVQTLPSPFMLARTLGRVLAVQFALDYSSWPGWTAGVRLLNSDVGDASLSGEWLLIRKSDQACVALGSSSIAHMREFAAGKSSLFSSLVVDSPAWQRVWSSANDGFSTADETALQYAATSSLAASDSLRRRLISGPVSLSPGLARLLAASIVSRSLVDSPANTETIQISRLGVVLAAAELSQSVCFLDWMSLQQAAGRLLTFRGAWNV